MRKCRIHSLFLVVLISIPLPLTSLGKSARGSILQSSKPSPSTQNSQKLREQMRLRFAEAYTVWELLDAVQVLLNNLDQQMGSSMMPNGLEANPDMVNTHFLVVNQVFHQADRRAGDLELNLLRTSKIAQPDTASHETALALVKELRIVRDKLGELQKVKQKTITAYRTYLQYLNHPRGIYRDEAASLLKRDHLLTLEPYTLKEPWSTRVLIVAEAIAQKTQ